MPSRRLDDRIRDLCARITASSPEHTNRLLKELQVAIREKIEVIRKLAASKLLGRSGPHGFERRSGMEKTNGDERHSGLEKTNGEHNNGRRAS